MTDILRINGTPLSGNSASFRVMGSPFYGVVEGSYKVKRERKVVYGARRNGKPLGKTAGKVSFECTMKMLKASADAFTTLLTPLGAGSYGDAEFFMTWQWFEPPSPSGIVLPITAVFSQCTIDEKGDATAEGVEELLTEFTIGCLDITENLKSIASIQRAIP